MADHVRIMAHLPVRGWARGQEYDVELTPDIELLAARGVISIAAKQGVPTPEPGPLEELEAIAAALEDDLVAEGPADDEGDPELTEDAADEDGDSERSWFRRRG